ncbi:acyl-CoA dehydrogenase family protein [Mycolicibacterium madagascariense]|nr:acyl-CoA dehydrogenase family protein [Mycolicibacterium madagascariense]MCV7013441.1 acyl-CoA dehydrogenase family protein [Mycolicibacterium madagascariense]
MTGHRAAWMDKDLDALADLARAFFEKECAPHEPRWCAQQLVDREIWRRAGELGLLCMSLPEEYGGGGGTFAHDAVVSIEQVRAMAPSFGGMLHSGIVAHYLNAYGTEEQKQRWLPPMATGDIITAIAMTEPGTGSDLQSITTSAVRDGDDYVINGAKTFISNGMLADLVVVAAKTDPTARGAEGVSLIAVESTRDGFRRGRNLAKIGQHGQDTCELFFDDVRVPAFNLIGDHEGQGFLQLMLQLPQERLFLAIAAAAAIEKTVDLTLAYTRERKAFGKPLLGFQNTQFVLAECDTVKTIAWTFLDDCIVRHLDAALDIPTAAKAKWWLTEQQCQVVDRCVQLFGGYGYMEEYPIARLYADARVQKVYGGTNEIMKTIIAKSL